MPVTKTIEEVEAAGRGLCRVDGCSRQLMYKKEALCQKHYFRLRRYGTTELTAGPRKIFVKKNMKGYVQVFAPDHPLAMSDGFVYEHRKVLFDSGLFCGSCTICGKAITWKSMHTDHINCVVDDNRLENLRSTCRGCNLKRNTREQHTRVGKGSVTHNGVTMTPEEWSRQPGVNLSGAGIRYRLKIGMCASDALFSRKITHRD